MTNLKPEERARVWMNRKLNDTGWNVINRDEFAPGMTAVAVREAPMKGGSKPITCSSTGKQQPFSKLNAKR